MSADLLTFYSSLFCIGCFSFLSKDAVTGCKLESTTKDIFTIVGKTTKLEWKFEVDVANNPNAIFQLQEPHYGVLYAVLIKTNRLFPNDRLKMKPFSNHITWTGNLSDNTASFVFSNVTHNLSLPYNLNLVNCGSSLITRTVTLQVIDPPTFKVSKSHDEKVINEGETLTEVCSTVGELPMTVQWLKDGVLVTPNQGINSSTLIINNSNRTDSGTYTCKATHKLVTIQRWLNVSVLYSPMIKSIGSSKGKSYVGQSVTLSCFFEGNPKPTNRWLTPNPSGRYISSFKNDLSVLRVVFNSSIDFGSYTCFVKNAIGSDNRTTRITQLFSPGKVYFWKNHTTAHAVILWWNKTRDNGGSPVTKYEITVHEGSTNIDAKETSDTNIDINNLVKNTSYTFCIRARNVVGFGDENCINITTKYVAPTMTTLSNQTKTTAGQGKTISAKGNCGAEWYLFVITTICGIIIGIVFSYATMWWRHRLSKRRDRSTPSTVGKPSGEGLENASTYEELDLQRMKNEEDNNYQSLMTSRNVPSNDAQVKSENEAGYEDVMHAKKKPSSLAIRD